MDVLQLGVNGLITGSIIALVALGITLVFGIQRFSNVGHGDMMTAGAYAAFWLLSLGLPMWLAGLGAVLLTVVLALGIHYLVFKPLLHHSPVAKVIASIGVALIVRHSIALIWGMGVRSYRLPVKAAYDVFGLKVTPTELTVLAVTLTVLIAFYLLIDRTRLGMEMRAVADLPDLARVSGIYADRIAMWTWVLAGVLAAVGGVVLAAKTVLSPQIGWQMLMTGFAAATLGGVGNLRGALAGGLVLGVAGELSTLILPEQYKLAVSLGAMVLVLLFRPSGIFGRAERV